MTIQLDHIKIPAESLVRKNSTQNVLVITKVPDSIRSSVSVLFNIPSNCCFASARYAQSPRPYKSAAVETQFKFTGVI